MTMDEQKQTAELLMYELKLSTSYWGNTTSSLGIFQDKEDALKRGLEHAKEKADMASGMDQKSASEWLNDEIRFSNDGVSYHYYISQVRIIPSSRATPDPVQDEKGEAVAWRVKRGSSNVWGYCETEKDADFFGNAGQMKYVKEPLYSRLSAAKPDAALEAFDRFSDKVLTFVYDYRDEDAKKDICTIRAALINSEEGEETHEFDMEDAINKAEWAKD